jgi:hypothetical protein
MLCFCFRQMIMPIELLSADLLTRSSLSWTLQISKPFKLLNFSAPQSRGRITWVVETERHIFLRKCVVTLSPAAHIKLVSIVHVKSHHFSLLLSKTVCFSFTSHCNAPPSTPPWPMNLIRFLMLPAMLLTPVLRVVLLRRARMLLRPPPRPWPIKP